MKRMWFSAALILFAVLSFGFSFSSWLIPLAAAALVIGVTALLIWLPARERIWRDVLFYAACVLLSCAFAYPVASSDQKIIDAYRGKTVQTTVTVCEDPTLCSNGSYRYIVRPSERLFSQKFVFFSKQQLTGAGGTVTGSFRFYDADDDFAEENRAQGIVLSAQFLSSEAKTEVTEPRTSFSALSARLRGWVRNTFSAFGGEEGAFCTALLTGDKQVLSSDLYQSLSDTAMLHLVAVSGLHVSAFAAFVLYFLRKIRNFRLRMFLSILSMTAILLLSCFTPSATRAVLMNLFAFTEKGFGESALPLNRLGAAGLLILLFDPHAALALSFQLSFAATFGILVLAPLLTRTATDLLFRRFNVRCGGALRFFVTGTCVSFAAFLFTFPVLWLRTGSFSAWSLLLTPLLLPVLEVCLFGAFLLLLTAPFPVLLPFARLLGTGVAGGVRVIVYVLRRCASVAGAVSITSDSVRWIAAAFLIAVGSLWFFSRRAPVSKRIRKTYRVRRVAAAALFAVLALCVYQFSAVFTARHLTSSAPEDGYFQTTFLSVGNGSCSVSVCGGSAFVVDCGGTVSAGDLAADHLSACGIDTVEFVILSDDSMERINGLQRLLARKTVKRVFYPDADSSAVLTVRRLASSAGAEAIAVTEDTTLAFSSAWVRLIPCASSRASDGVTLAVLAEYGNFRALFCSALSVGAQNALTDRFGTVLDCDVLSVPNGADAAGTGEDFLTALTPNCAVISVGENTDGLPSSEVLARLSACGASVWRTDRYAAVTFRTDGSEMEVLTEK